MGDASADNINNKMIEATADSSDEGATSSTKNDDSKQQPTATATTTTDSKGEAKAETKKEEESAGTAATKTDAAGADDSVKSEKGSEAAPVKKEPEKKKKNVDWPMRGIQEPHENDVLFGRGGGTNHHPGNKRYRKVVEDRKLDYVNSKRLDKPLVAIEIIREWRSQDPPGRFLKMDERTGLWSDVGDKKAREKTSQALREKAPMIRKQQEEERKDNDGDDHGANDDDDDDDSEKADEVVKTTRFAEGTNLKQGVKKAILARDHSLGREYLDEGEAVTLEGFSWQDPFQSGTSRTPSVDSRPSSAGEPVRTSRSRSPTEPTNASSDFRFPSQGSLGPPPPPPPPGAYAHMASNQDRQDFYKAHGRYESWGSYPPYPPPPPGYGYPPPPHLASGAGNWPPPREHSLCRNPLPHASVSQPAPYPFGSSRSGGSWGPPPPPPPQGYPHPGPPPYRPQSHPGLPPPPPPPPPAYPPPPLALTSHDPYSPSRRSSSGSCGPTVPPSPPYAVDPAVASAWSGQDPQEIAKSWSAGSSDEYDRPRSSPKAGAVGICSGVSPRGVEISEGAMSSHAVRPDLVKRGTSNQNETVETKPSLRGPSVKRAALNRDNSLASNRLKEKYVPGLRKSCAGISSSRFNAEQAMSQLTENMELSTLETGKESPMLLLPVLDSGESCNTKPVKKGDKHPNPLTKDQRQSTIDQIAMDLIVKPVALSSSTRSSTIEALALDLELDPWVRPEPVQRGRTMEEVFKELRDGVPKPAMLSKADRLTTSDFLDIVNEPLIDDDAEMFSERDKPLTISRDTSLSGWV